MNPTLPLLLPLLLPAPLQDETPPTAELPDAQTVLARHAAATGSPEARAALRSLWLRGTIEIPGMPEGFGTMQSEELHAGTAARQTNSTTSQAMTMTMTMGTTGAWSWSTDPAMGITIREGPAGSVVRRLFAVFRGAAAEGMYTSAETVGRTEVEGRECFELRLQPPGGGPETWFVDAETGLLARYDVALPNPQPSGGSFPVQFLFSNYEPVGGLQIARTRKQRMGATTLVYRFDEVRANAELPAGRLAPPGEVQAAFDDPQRVRDEGGEFDPTAVVLEVVEERPLASIRVTLPEEEISAGLAVILPEVWSHLTAVGAQMDGPPLTRIHSHADGKVDLEAGIPVRRPIEPAGRIRASSLPAGLTASTWHVGPYHELGETHERLDAWLEEHGRTKRGAAWEIYWTDPGIEPDPAKWRTQVVAPIEGDPPGDK